MKLYEITYLTRNEQTPQAEAINSTLEAHQAIVQHAHLWGGRRKLAYPINKEDQAFYTTVVFEVDPAQIQSMEESLRHNDEIIRSLIVEYEPGVFDRVPVTEKEEKESKSEVRPEKAERETAAKITGETVSDSPKEATKPAAAVELPKVEEKSKRAPRKAKPTKDLDKKLEELLNEDITK